MFKIKNKLPATLIQELFTENDNSHDLRNKRSWVADNIRVNDYVKETFLYKGPKIWGVPSDIKNSPTLKVFK